MPLHHHLTSFYGGTGTLAMSGDGTRHTNTVVSIRSSKSSEIVAMLREAIEYLGAGSYTRTDEDWKARAEKAEQERDEWKDSAIKAMADLERAEQPRPLTPDAITDEMVNRARKAWNLSAALGNDLWRDVLSAALTPARPEGAEELARLIAAADVDEWDCGDLADALLATGRVRVVTEEQP